MPTRSTRSMRERVQAWATRATAPRTSRPELIDTARALLATGALGSLLSSPDDEVRAVKELRTQVPGLGLVDAVHLVRAARG